MEEQLWLGQGCRRHRQRPRSHLVRNADKVEQQLFREPLSIRMGTDEESRGRTSVDAEEWRWRRNGSGSAGSVEAALALDADHGPFAAVRSGVRENLAPLP